MATDTADIDDEEFDDDAEDGEGSEEKPKKLSGKKIILFGVVPLLVIGLGLGGAYMFGLFGSSEHAEGDVAEEEAIDESDVVFYELPEILVTLNSAGRSSNYLKMKIALELPDKEGVERLEALLPRIIDNFQVYLRELRLEDLNGSAGLFRLKEELLIRVNAAVHPVRVSDVLFKEMLVQ